MSEDIHYKTFSSPPTTAALSKYLFEHFPGATYHTAYEAGFSGFWLHRELTSLGIKSMVVNPADIPTTDKERTQKEDKAIASISLTIPVEQVIPSKLFSSRACFRFACWVEIERMN
jgi:transposase